MKSLITILLLGFFISSEAQNISQSQVRQFNAVPAYRVFGRGSGVGSPSFIQLDSNHIPLLHSQGYYDGRFQPLGSYLSNITGLVSAGTNVSLTGSGTSASPYVINSTASGSSGIPTLQQVTGAGNATADQIVSPTHRFTYASLNGSVDSIISYGDSYTVGLNSTGNALGYAKLLSTSYNLPFLNLGFSSSGSFYAAKTAYAHTQPLHNNLETVMAGLNDVRRGSSARATLNKIIWGHNAIIANHFMKSYVAAGASFVSRVGTWTTGFNVTTGGGKTTNGATTTTINDNISYSFTDSTVIIGLQGADGTAFAYADFTIYIDNVVYASKTENAQTDGLADVNDPNTLSAMAIIIRGLTNTSHTVKLVNNSSGKTLVVDYFGHLLDASFGKPILVFDIPYLPTGSYSLGSPYNSGSIAATDVANGKVDSLLTGFSGYPVYKVKTNNFYTNTTASGDVSGDLIHPTDQGHQHIRNAALAVYNYSAPAIVEGTQRFDFTQHKISWFDGSAWQTPSNSSATFNDANVLHKTGDETITSGTKTIASAITSIGGATATLISPLKVIPNLTASLASDTTAAIYINPTLTTNTANRWGIYSTRDFNVNGVRMGIGNSTDQSNVVMGKSALDAVTTGSSGQFTAIGSSSFKSATNASFQNTGVGASTGTAVTTGTANTAVGANALQSTAVSSTSNVAVGVNTLAQITGNNNVGVGNSAGRNASSNGIFIGNQAGTSETASGAVVIHNATTGGLIAGNATNGQLIINAQKNHPTPSTTVLSGAAFEVYNNYNTANRGSIPSTIMLQAQRDAIALQTGIITRIYITSQNGFTSAPTIAISGSGTGAAATATLSGGALYITVTNGGTGYTPNSTTVTLSGGGGTGTAYALVGAQGLSVFCADCTATDGSTGVLQYYNGAAWKNAW